VPDIRHNPAQTAIMKARPTEDATGSRTKKRVATTPQQDMITNLL
jgi:nuclear transport factor 2 (NTF2) superfamily protein